MISNIIKKIYYKIITQTIHRFDDIYDLNHKIYGDIKMVGSHYRVKHRNFYGANSEPDLISFINDLPKNKVIWDVGANVGYFSIFAAKMGHKVLAFEPDQLTTNYLNKNIYVNNVSDRCLAIPIALTNKTEINVFYMRNFRPANAYNTFGRKINEWGTSFNEQFKQGAFGVKASDLVIPNAFNYYSNPYFLKVDVDGNELLVLLGFGKKLANIKYLCIELAPKNPEFLKIFKLLDSSGFEEIKNPLYIDKKREKNGMRNYYFENMKLE